ncbi:hypothetical protein Godav_003654, partial [Gossypium davidsonii]|nr:hypothetical protein [Gossypium davidsonii]MBA0661487.1 hypothetical protein [Gossypium klotzschianum]
IIVISWILGIGIIGINVYYLITSFVDWLIHNDVPKVGNVFIGIIVFPLMAIYIIAVIYLTFRKDIVVTYVEPQKDEAADTQRTSLSRILIGKTLLKLKLLNPSIPPQLLKNSSGIELNKLLEKSSDCKESIWQSMGRKVELERPNPAKERESMKLLRGELHVTPLQWQRFGSIPTF